MWSFIEYRYTTEASGQMNFGQKNSDTKPQLTAQVRQEKSRAVKPHDFSGFNHQQKSIAKVHLEKSALNY